MMVLLISLPQITVELIMRLQFFVLDGSLQTQFVQLQQIQLMVQQVWKLMVPLPELLTQVLILYL